MEKDVNLPKLHEIPPRECAGRDTIARYQCQFKAAAYECLSLLEDGNIDRVYCDYQDDYVSRLNFDGSYVYHFYQVKTKEKLNHQWSTNEILGILKNATKKVDIEKFSNSFAGKLLIHTVNFKNSCGKVVFLTNIHFDDSVEAFKKAVSNEELSNRHYKLVMENFNGAFSHGETIEKPNVTALLKKLELKSNISYLTPHENTFTALARDTIYKFSEIDLQHGECEEILNNLVGLVEKKSLGKLVSSIDEADLDEIAGVGISDILDILSISKGAYKKLKDGGDTQAIKNASIIHRLLCRAGASEKMIEYSSGCKVKWDIWFRDKRHTMLEFDLNFLQEKISIIASSWTSGQKTMDELQESIETLFSLITEKGIVGTLSKDLLLGAIFSAVVRSEA